MRKTIQVSVFALSLLLLSACGKEKSQDKVMGYKPVYETKGDLQKVEIRSGEALESPGRIYVYGHYLLINDQSKGIHIYDNSNVSAPKEVSFIAIPGNLDFSVKGGMLYADNITDMVIVNITNPANPIYENRISNVFPIQEFPDEFGAFECVDPAKGTVIGWEKAELNNPQCFK